MAGSKVLLHIGGKCGTVQSGQNGQKCPPNKKKTVGPLLPGVKKGGTRVDSVTASLLYWVTQYNSETLTLSNGMFPSQIHYSVMGHQWWDCIFYNWSRMSLLPPSCMDIWTWRAKKVETTTEMQESMSGCEWGWGWGARVERKRRCLD